MPKINDVLKANNLEFVGYWDATFFYKSSRSGGLILRDASGKDHSLTWSELKKLSEGKYKYDNSTHNFVNCIDSSPARKQHKIDF